MEVLYVGANAEWKAADIEVELSKIAETKQILYAVSDKGHNLRKAYKSLNYTHIADCTHILANFLKRLYDKDVSFVAFRKLIGDLRKKWNLSKENSRFMPPMMRGKMRFANIFPCVNWAKLCLEKWKKLSKKVQESLVFLKENEAFIGTLVEISKAFKMLCEKLKNEGFGTAQKASVLAELALISASTNDEKCLTFIENCKEYLDNLSQKTSELGEQHLLVSSDIIESFFGKFKTKIKGNNRSGLTEFIFTISNFSQVFTEEETKMALENVKLKDLKRNKKRTKTA
jgi:hypothetical protein